jgi:hypothetical protein
MNPEFMLGSIMVVMAVLGAALSIHGFKSKLNKILLMLVFIGLGTYAVYLISVQANKNARASAKLDNNIAQLRISLAETSRLQKLNSELQERLFEQTKTIIALSKKAIDTTVGGDSFGYIAAVNPWTPNNWIPTFAFKGKHPLYGVKARIVNADNKFTETPFTVQEAIKFLTQDTIDVGDVAADEHMGLAFDRPIPMSNGSGSFNIFFSARNGSWSESLKLVNMNGKYLQAIQVRRGDKVIFEQIADGFPRNQKGEIEGFK